MSIIWISVDDELPPLSEWVLTHSRAKGWNPGTAYRHPMAGRGWVWSSDDNCEFDGLEFWARIPPLPQLDLAQNTVGREPTQEEILASIRRIISEEEVETAEPVPEPKPARKSRAKKAA